MDYPVGLREEFDFGKYKGKTIGEVIEEDHSYIEWCLDTVNNFSLDAEAENELSDKQMDDDYEDDYNDWEYRSWGDLD